MKLTVKKILEITKGQLITGDENLEIESYSKDTRTIKKNDCYIGIKGETFDGNLFWEDAKEKGACACLLDSFEGKIEEKDPFTIILVSDTIAAIQALAHYVRIESHAKVVAITGSAGKTSTKDMIASVLEEKYKILKTPGNLNGQIGLPLNILAYKDEPVWVLEMGMNDFGQLKELSSIASPDVAVITNIGTAHIGILGSRENILKAKLEILEGMNDKGVLVLNGDNDLLKTVKTDLKQVTFGLESGNDIVATDIKMDGEKTICKIENNEIEIPVMGEVFVYNALAAYAVGKLFSLTPEEIKNGIASFQMSNNRMNTIKTTKFTIINDTYNANPDSVKSAIKTLGTFKNRKVAILGDMLELGENEKKYHQEIGEFCNEKIDVLITIGVLSKNMFDKFTKEKYFFKTNEEAETKLKDILKQDDVILVKASHSMKLDTIVNFLKENQ